MSQDKKIITNCKGTTLVELTLVASLVSIVIVSVGAVLVDSQRGWNKMYNRAYSDIVTDAHVARRSFDRVVRNASSQGILLDTDGNWLEVYGYSDPNSVVIDRYARFISSDGGLILEYGALDPRQTLSTETICGNVSSCIFKSTSNSAQMVLTLDDGMRSTTVVASAVMQNQ